MTFTRLYVTCAALLALALLPGASACAAETPRPVRVLVITSVTEGSNHIYVTGAEREPVRTKRLFGVPDAGRSRVAVLYTRMAALNSTFVRTMAGFERDPAMQAAMTQAFKERSPMFEITTTSDADRYLRGISGKLTDAPRGEGFDFAIALHDEFAGLATRDDEDAFQGLMTPAYNVTYSLYDVALNKVIRRGHASATGYLRESYQTAAADRGLFEKLWPYVCTLNATTIVDELLYADQLHAMARAVGRGDELPPVSKRLTELERKLKWKLDPSVGWRDRPVSRFTRILEPNSVTPVLMRIRYDVDFLIPELGQDVGSVGEYLDIFERNRRRQTPDAVPLTRFTDITASGYEAHRYVGEAGEHNVVLFRDLEGPGVSIVTISIAGEFDALYPPARATLEKMIARSEVQLRH